jgi:hypothetical protein
LQQIITTICCPLIKTKKDTVERKLYGHFLRIKSQHNINPKVVRNLSTRILSNDEVDCLANGLDYGLVPRRFDEMRAVGNVEQFFHRVTDIFQHHKKLMADLKDKDKVIPNDIRVLNTKEMTLASHLRSLTDTFQHQADRYRQKQYRMNREQGQYYKLLKSLKEDESIIVTRPDKGRGIVLMNKSDYLSKMQAILNDSTKFECLSDDLTIERERSLTNLLRRLKKRGHISEQFWYMAKPTGSNPGRLYGLPKLHKEGTPLRPVLSSIGTYNYGLAKALKHMLSDMVRNEAVIKDTFAFINDLQSISKDFSKYKMVSFDITNLYTNIPVDETIRLILNYLYDIEAPPSNVIKRIDMQKLLNFATKKSHFLFNGKVYDQKDGVSMGSPLAPLLAEIFLQDFEKKHLPSFKEMGIVYWKRYVDDTFVLLDPQVSADDICDKLSQCHPALKFTVEEERSPTEEDIKKITHNTENYYSNKTKVAKKEKDEKKKEDEKKEEDTSPKPYLLSFLDVLIQRIPGIEFKTQVHRKPTFSGLITKWNSFVPKSYKYNAISSMVYRARKICSTYEALASELDIIRDISLQNGYPIAFVESVIRRQLNMQISPRVITPKLPESDIVVLRVPYYGKPSQIYGKRVAAAVAKQYPLKKVRVVYDVTARIGQNFTSKDPITTQLKSGVVYEATCPSCNEKYIGKTCRHLKTRIGEHLLDQKKVLIPSLPQPEPNLAPQLPQSTVEPEIESHNDSILNSVSNPNTLHILKIGKQYFKTIR